MYRKLPMLFRIPVTTGADVLDIGYVVTRCKDYEVEETREVS